MVAVAIHYRLLFFRSLFVGLSTAKFLLVPQTYMYDQQKFNLNFKSSNTEEYNNPFNLVELKEAINKSHDIATGPDEVDYQMLKHLPP